LGRIPRPEDAAVKHGPGLLLETEDREATGARNPTSDSADNVVRFPREWIGPREELVPFGPSAEQPQDEAAPTEGGAADFWGEGSAAVQAVVEDGAGDASVGSCPRAGRRRRPRLLVAGALLLTLVVVIGSVLGAGGAARRGHAPRSVVSLASIGPSGLSGSATHGASVPRSHVVHRVRAKRAAKSHAVRSSSKGRASVEETESATNSVAGVNQSVSSPSPAPTVSEPSPTYSSSQRSAPASPPAASGGLTCISNCG
jgi:hypothetical protein